MTTAGERGVKKGKRIQRLVARREPWETTPERGVMEGGLGPVAIQSAAETKTGQLVTRGTIQVQWI